MGHVSKEVKKRWLFTPIPVTEIPDKDKSSLARRFVVRQTDNVRPIDNYKWSGVNDATAIYSKYNCHPWITLLKLLGA